MRPYVFFIPLLLIAPFLVVKADSPTPSLLMSKLGSAQATSIGAGCFYPITVMVNATYTGPKPYFVGLSNFWLVATSRNLLVTNSTVSSYEQPNNLVSIVTLFQNIPVRIQLNFSPFCPSSVNVLELLYTDGSYSYTFPLP